MRFSTSHTWTVYVIPNPQWVAQDVILLFLPVKFNFCRKTFAAKFLYVKTSSSTVVDTSFLYLKVYGWIAGDVPSTKNLRSKWPTPIENADFEGFRLTVPQQKSWIIANRKSTVRFPSSHCWTLCVTPKSPKGWLKTRIFTFGIAFHFFLAGNSRHFKFNRWFEHSKCQPIISRKRY